MDCETLGETGGPGLVVNEMGAREQLILSIRVQLARRSMEMSSLSQLIVVLRKCWLENRLSVDCPQPTQDTLA